jgi:hypothetical protein
MKIKKDGGENDLITFISTETVKFIMINFPSTPNQSLVASEFTMDLISEKNDWKKDDVKMFFKFVRTQGIEELKVYGNIITPIKLFELVRYYEDEKSVRRESHYRKYKELGREEKLLTTEEPIRKEQMDEYVKRILKTVSDHTPKIAYTGKPQKLFDPVIHESDYDTFLKLIPDLSAEEKEKFRTSIYNFESIIPTEMARREHLIEKLK